MLVAFPVPVPEGTPGWVGALFGLAAITAFAVVLWQVVRYFRDHRDDH